MISIWTKDYIDYKLPIVNKDIETPILIIGGWNIRFNVRLFSYERKTGFYFNRS